MKKFKLKYEAIQYFEKYLANAVEPLEYWKNKNVSENAIEEVGNTYITYGVKKGGYTDLCRWQSDGSMAHFHFTLNTGMDRERYDYIKDNTHTLLKVIQARIDEFLHSEKCDLPF